MRHFLFFLGVSFHLNAHSLPTLNHNELRELFETFNSKKYDERQNAYESLLSPHDTETDHKILEIAIDLIREEKGDNSADAISRSMNLIKAFSVDVENNRSRFSLKAIREIINNNEAVSQSFKLFLESDNFLSKISNNVLHVLTGNGMKYIKNERTDRASITFDADWSGSKADLFFLRYLKFYHLIILDHVDQFFDHEDHYFSQENKINITFGGFKIDPEFAKKFIDTFPGNIETSHITFLYSQLPGNTEDFARMLENFFSKTSTPKQSFKTYHVTHYGWQSDSSVREYSDTLKKKMISAHKKRLFLSLYGPVNLGLVLTSASINNSKYMKVHRINPNATCSDSPLKPGDYIVTINGESFEHYGAFNEAVAKFAFKPIEIVYLDGETKEAQTITLAPIHFNHIGQL